jgi:hypothetical protein
MSATPRRTQDNELPTDERDPTGSPELGIQPQVDALSAGTAVAADNDADPSRT